jgi:hypothetical protein
MRRRRPALTVLVVAMAVVACQPGPAEDLTDPRDILSRTIRATSQLRTVDVRLELEAGGPDGVVVGGLEAGTAEVRLDLVAGEADGRVLDRAGAEQGRFILVDESLFTTTGRGRWATFGLPEGGLANPAFLFLGAGAGGEGPDFVAILSQAVREPSIDVRLAGTEDCRPGRCYRTLVNIPPEVVWPLVAGLAGFDRLPGFAAPPPDADIPAVALSVLTDTATLRLEELALGVSIGASAVDVRLSLANHDEPLTIVPPPANLVDPGVDMGGGIGPAVPAPPPEQPLPVPVPDPAVPLPTAPPDE